MEWELTERDEMERMGRCQMGKGGRDGKGEGGRSRLCCVGRIVYRWQRRGRRGYVIYLSCETTLSKTTHAGTSPLRTTQTHHQPTSLISLPNSPVPSFRSKGKEKGDEDWKGLHDRCDYTAGVGVMPEFG